MAEVHDCFTPTELVLMEDLGFCERGTAWKEVQAGAFDLTGDLPVNPDGGLKSFGHPVGASGLRMMFEAWLQLRDEAPAERQIATTADRHLALTHNLGGYPGEMVSFVSILGTDRRLTSGRRCPRSARPAGRACRRAAWSSRPSSQLARPGPRPPGPVEHVDRVALRHQDRVGAGTDGHGRREVEAVADVHRHPSRGRR